MAITHNGVKNSLTESQIPTGYTRPTVTTFTDWDWKQTKVFTIAKANVENATASTTMTNMINDATYGLDVLVEAELANDFVATNTVTAWSDWVLLETNQSPLNSTSEWLTTTAENYECTVNIYVKVA